MARLLAPVLGMDADVYQDRQDTTVSVAVKMRDEDDAYAVFWTTTPWTVPTNFAIVVGEALKQALGDKRGIRRFADATVPLDEALAKAVVDISGRPYCVCSGEPEGYEFCMIGGHFTGSLVRHVMESIAFHAGICLHMQVLAGRDPHHIAEAEFKALARALRFAVEPDPRIQGLIPSTKGAL